MARRACVVDGGDTQSPLASTKEQQVHSCESQEPQMVIIILGTDCVSTFTEVDIVAAMS